MPTPKGAFIIARIESDIEHMPFPAFVMSVEGSGFVVRSVNTAYRDAIGTAEVGSKLTAGSSDDRSTSRLIDHLCQCRDQKQPVYLDMPFEKQASLRWWRKGLHPVCAPGGQVVAIVGGAVDITEEKTSLFALTHRISQQAHSIEERDIALHDTIHDLKDTLANAQALLDMITCDFMDLGDDKPALLSECARHVRQGQAQLTRIETTVLDHLPDQPRTSRVDFSVNCAELAAILDPGDRFRISYCEAIVDVDRVLLHLSLRALLQNALRHATLWVTLDIGASQTGGLLLSVTDDGVGWGGKMRPNGQSLLPDGHPAHPLHDLMLLLQKRGGQLNKTIDPAGQSITISASLPGVLIDNDTASVAYLAG